jgi:hypothetical protein
MSMPNASSNLTSISSTAILSKLGYGSDFENHHNRDLILDTVTLSNFGPFGGEKVIYPLSKRGLVLITGQSSDGTCADSNGAGKVIKLTMILVKSSL